MKTNSPLSGRAAHRTTTSQVPWYNPARSLQDRSLHTDEATAGVASIRIPVVPENRAYLKALRQAELAAWREADAVRKTSAGPRPNSPRLPTVKGAPGEDRWYVLLTLLSFMVLGSEFWSVWQSAPQWGNFVAFVRQLLT